MATNNLLCGADRIRGKLLTRDIKVANRTIQSYMREPRSARLHGQTSPTFLRNHANDMWACHFLPVTDVLFRPLFAFLITKLGSRRIGQTAAVERRYALVGRLANFFRRIM